jgi:hypothetical protein
MKAPVGHIKLSRKFFASPEWVGPRVFPEADAWIDLIQMAQWQDRVFHTKRFGTIELKRGEFVGSVRRLAKRWSWSEYAVRAFLGHAQQITRITAQRITQAGTVYLVVNYDSYQSTTSKSRTANRTADRTPDRTREKQLSIPKQVNTQLGAASDDAEPAVPSSLERLPKSTADAAYTIWGSRLGAINYPRLRNALMGCVEVGIAHELLPNAVDAYADWFEGLADRDKQFNSPSPERFATEAQRWARLGQQGYATLDGPTERGMLLLKNAFTKGAA